MEMNKDVNIGDAIHRFAEIAEQFIEMPQLPGMLFGKLIVIEQGVTDKQLMDLGFTDPETIKKMQNVISNLPRRIRFPQVREVNGRSVDFSKSIPIFWNRIEMYKWFEEEQHCGMWWVPELMDEDITSNIIPIDFR